MEFILLMALTIFLIIYRLNDGESAYKFVTKQVTNVYNKYAPYSFKSVNEKVSKLGLAYSAKQYTTQLILISTAAFAVRSALKPLSWQDHGR